MEKGQKRGNGHWSRVQERRPLRRTRKASQRSVKDQWGMVSWKLRLKRVSVRERPVISQAAERTRRVGTETHPSAFLTRSFGDLYEDGFLEGETEAIFQRSQRSELEMQNGNSWFAQLFENIW